MRFVRGGELFTILRDEAKISEQRARLYTYNIALAMGYLHKKKIVYRDLKPENVLVDEKGYLVLTDFGLAKILEKDEATDTFCGTPEYMAPEIQNDVDGYGFEVDWWSLGILCYEMIVGFAPFYAKKNQHPDEVFRIIREKKIVFPDPIRHGI
jgi:serine/threonine protein kinase